MPAQLAVEHIQGLPEEWKALLKSNISKEEVLENPEAVLDVLEFHDKQYGIRQDDEKPISTETRLPPEGHLDDEGLFSTLCFPSTSNLRRVAFDN